MADPTDPRRFTLRGRPDVFDLEAGRDMYEEWRLQYDAFLATSGVNNLTQGDVAGEQQARNDAIATIKKNVAVLAFTQETLKRIRNMGGQEMATAASMVTAVATMVNASSNTIVRAWELQTTKRKEGEQIEDFAIAVRDRGAKCGYDTVVLTAAAFLDRALRDAFTLTVNDDEAVREILKLPSDASFAQAVTAAKAVLQARQHAEMMAGGTSALVPAAARLQVQRPQRSQRRGGGGLGRSDGSDSRASCRGCGRRGGHRQGQYCPAQDAQCHGCDQYGHFQAVCPGPPRRREDRREDRRSNHRGKRQGRRPAGQARAMEADGEDNYYSEEDMVGEMNCLQFLTLELPQIAELQGHKPLRALQRIGVVTSAARLPTLTARVDYLPDPGANITAVPPRVLRDMGIRRDQLQGQKAKLPAPAQADGSAGRLRTVGFFAGRLTFADLEHHEEIFVIRGLDRPLLSKWACLALGIYESKVLTGGQVAAEARANRNRGSGARKIATQLYDAKQGLNISDNKLSGHCLPTVLSCASKFNIPRAPPPPPAPVVPDARRKAAWERLQATHPQPLDGVCRVMRGGKVHIKLRPEAALTSVYSTRPVPIPLREAFAQEIEAMLLDDIIEPADDPNDPPPLISPTVTVRKKQKKPGDPPACRITVDLKTLNKATFRTPFLAPAPFQVVTEIDNNAAYFTVVDGLKGYHQLELDRESSKLTTFVTPLGRFRYKRVPMGWHGSADVFGERMEGIFGRLPGVHRIVEDILIASPTWEQHVQDVDAILKIAEEHNVSFNTSKVQFGVTEAKFGGFVVSRGHFRIDSELAAGVANFPVPTNRTELRSFLGLVQQLSTFTDEVTAIVHPMRCLNKNGVVWRWTPEMQAAFEKARRVLSAPPYLAYFDPKRPTELLTDAARTKGLGFLLRQRATDGHWRAVMCGSRTLASHEANWSGVAEIEALGAAWAAKRCALFLDGLPHFTLVTDCNPLVPILNDRRLDQVANDRLLKLKTALARYNFTARWQSGAKHVIADALSRSPVSTPREEDLLLVDRDDEDREFMVAMALSTLVGEQPQQLREHQDEQLQQIQCAGEADEEYRALRSTHYVGWQQKGKNGVADRFFSHRGDVTVVDGLILVAGRLFIPHQLRRETLGRLHAGHQGSTKMLARALTSVWWPGLTNEVKNTAAACTTCRERLPTQPHEETQDKEQVTEPFARLHMDIFQARGCHYLVAVDEGTGWPMLQELKPNTTSTIVIQALRAIFEAHGRPHSIKSDGGPQLGSQAVRDFLNRWQVRLEISSPHLPRTNGRAEAAVKTMKKLVLGSFPRGATRPDPDAIASGILTIRNTPKYGGRSPAEHFLGRAISDMVPTQGRKLAGKPLCPDKVEQNRKQQLQTRYNMRAKALPAFQPLTQVWLQDPVTKRWNTAAQIISVLPNHEYQVKQASGRVLRRHRTLLRRRYMVLGTGAGRALRPQQAQLQPQHPPDHQAPNPEDQQPWEPVLRRSSRSRCPPARIADSNFTSQFPRMARPQASKTSGRR